MHCFLISDIIGPIRNLHVGNLKYPKPNKFFESQKIQKLELKVIKIIK
jgi:hypothetical protein